MQKDLDMARMNAARAQDQQTGGNAAHWEVQRQMAIRGTPAVATSVFAQVHLQKIVRPYTVPIRPDRPSEQLQITAMLRAENDQLRADNARLLQEEQVFGERYAQMELTLAGYKEQLEYLQLRGQS